MARSKKFWEEQSTSEKASSVDKSLPKILFKGKFHLSEDDFQVGLSEGQFAEVVAKDGSIRYSWNVQAQEVSQTSSSHKRIQSEAKLSAKEAKVEQAVMGSWKIGLFQGIGSQKALTGPNRPLALLDKEEELSDDLWNQAQAQLSQAKATYDKMMKDCKRALQSIGVDNREDSLFPQLLLAALLSSYVHA